MCREMNFAVVGTGKMASDVLGIISDFEGATAKLAIGDPKIETAQSKLARKCEVLGVPFFACDSLSSARAIDALSEAKLDYIVSANNFMIFREASLAAARRGIVNFHNGPLPRYRGLNACSWALYNSEANHGVTWHLVDDGIDTGPVLAQKMFEVEQDASAIGLIARCIVLGVDLFSEMLPSLVADTLVPKPQDDSASLYYRAHERPWDGALPWWKGIDEIERIERMLSFAPMPNLYYRPSIKTASGCKLFAERIVSSRCSQPSPPGTIVLTSSDEIQIATAGGKVSCQDMRQVSGEPALQIELSNFQPGSSLIDG